MEDERANRGAGRDIRSRDETAGGKGSKRVRSGRNSGKSRKDA